MTASPLLSGLCRILEEDPELAEAIDPELRSQATEAIVTREIRLEPGAWRPPPAAFENGLGVLVLEGILIHRVGLEKRFGVELIGEGDLLRPPPWHPESTLTLTNDWLVLDPVRVAVLDERFVRQLAQFPQLGGRLVSRATQRSRQLAVNMAIVHQARVDVRLHMLFWHLAGRWGRVRRDGIIVPLRLTHAVLSDLVAARRPTVTSALSDLARRGIVRAVSDGWLLSGDPPGPSSAE
ncbi:MAG: Crp/Fnr family transcriptional regulator [Actinomycetota bacterium]|nr:Crp/Fnr family transcriptional regulator [Actinomycetota bacterium]